MSNFVTTRTIFAIIVLVFGLTACVKRREVNERYQFKTGNQRYQGSDAELLLGNSAFENPDPDESSSSKGGDDGQSSGEDGKGSGEQEEIDDDQNGSGNPNQAPTQKPDEPKGKGDDDTDTTTDTQTDTNTGTDTDTDTDPEPTPQTVCPDTEFTVSRLCSNKAATAAGKWRVHWGETLIDNVNAFSVRAVPHANPNSIAQEWKAAEQITAIANSVFFQKKFTLNLTELADGQYDILFCANDTAGNCKAMHGRKIASGVFTKNGCEVTPGVVTVLVGRANPGKYNGQKIPCDSVASPLIIDLENTGIRLSSPVNGVAFDIDGDGLKEKISWPEDQDSVFLVLDVNKNGKIDNAKELFGNSSALPDGSMPANGFAALAYYDDNRDGVIDARDKVYNSLRVWADGNRDGVSSSSELSSLSAKKIQSINLKYIDGLEADYYGNQTRERSVVTMGDGTKRLIVDIWFLPREL